MSLASHTSRMQARTSTRPFTTARGLNASRSRSCTLPARRTISTLRSTAEETSASSGPPTDVCATCGVAKGDIPAGCEGSGRIVGGMGAIPGFGWWPIKAYRPCPKLAETGVGYVRKGQGTDEILFGGVSLSDTARKAYDEQKSRSQR